MSVLLFNKNHCIFLVIFSCFLIFSCTFSSSGISIDEQLSQVDSLIAVGDYDAAWSSLKKVAKTIRNSSETLGVVKRAFLLQKDDFAKEQLEDALDKNPDNQELLAVYAHMLISENEYDLALPYAQKLEGGEYGSIYSELRFKLEEHTINERNAEKKDGEEPEVINYYLEEYVQAYIDIYYSTGDASYLRNAALVYAIQGNMAKAFLLHPEKVSSYESPWFWAQVSYDAYQFEQVIADLQVFEYSSDELSLLADAYVQLDLLQEAQSIWLKSTNMYYSENPIAWHNIALYYQLQGDSTAANNVISHLVNTFPDYVYGLAAYGYFSLFDSSHSNESIFVPILEEKNMQTLLMEKNAERIFLDSSDALLKMDSAIDDLLQVDETMAMELLVERLKLTWETAINPLTSQQKVSDVWNLLEQNVQEPYGYNSVLVQFAMWFFFTQGMIDEADALFVTHCTSRYASYYESVGAYTKKPIDYMKTWEYEYGAYVALRQERYDDAQHWLLRLMPENIVSAATPISSAFNLTTLYNATGKRALALSLYNQMLTFVKDSKQRADVYYRMALIYNEEGETKRASISLNEALTLDSNHSESRLLLKKITQ